MLRVASNGLSDHQVCFLPMGLSPRQFLSLQLSGCGQHLSLDSMVYLALALQPAIVAEQPRKHMALNSSQYVTAIATPCKGHVSWSSWQQ